MKKEFSSYITIVAGMMLSGCMSMSGQSTLDAVQDALTSKGEPQVFTEAYVEFSGPGARWAGPQAFLMHISAKDPSRPAEVSVSLDMFDLKKGAPEVATEGRAPASVKESAVAKADEAPPVAKAVDPGSQLTAAQAREQMAYLATAVQGEEKAYAGCLYPIRVRLVRTDGALVDRQGCRGQTPWARVASQAVDYFMMKTR